MKKLRERRLSLVSRCTLLCGASGLSFGFVFMSKLTVGMALFGTLAATPRSSEARSCAGGGGISSAYRGATAILVATIDNVAPPRAVWTQHPDGSVNGEFKSGPDLVDLSVAEVFKGALRGRLRLLSDVRFVEKETYLVYVSDLVGTLRVSTCSRTRALLEAKEDLKYLNGLWAGTSQAEIFGSVFRGRTDSLGEYGLYAPKDRFDIVALKSGSRYQVETSDSGQFHIILPPGSYLVWLEKDGRLLANPETIELLDKDERMKVLVVHGPG